jgi:hypothetical protein
MSGLPTAADDFWSLLDAICDGELAPEQRSKLDMCLDRNLDAQRIYLDHIWLCVQVNAWSRGKRSGKAGLARVASSLQKSADAGGEASVTAGGAVVEMPLQLTGSGVSRDGSPFVLGFPWLLHLPGGDALVAYLLAAVLLGSGIFAAWAWVASENGRSSAGRAAVPRAAGHDERKQYVIVGEITEMVDCRWADSKMALADGQDIVLGRKFDLLSGKIEIKYALGTRVLLQGPARFDVDFLHGGRLSFGKIAVRPAILNRAWADAGTPGFSGTVTVDRRLFAVHTPRAIVINRGAQFTVSVDKFGANHTHLVDGTLEIRYPSGIGSGDRVSYAVDSWWLTSRGPNNRTRVVIRTGEMPLGLASIAGDSKGAKPDGNRIEFGYYDHRTKRVWQSTPPP